MLFDLSFQRRPIFGSRIKDHIAAGDKGFDIRQAEGCKQTAKIVHLDCVSADIYGPQQGYVFWHRGCLVREPSCTKRMRALILPPLSCEYHLREEWVSSRRMISINLLPV